MLPPGACAWAVEISIGMDLEMVRRANRSKRRIEPQHSRPRPSAPGELVRLDQIKGNAGAVRAFQPEAGCVIYPAPPLPEPRPMTEAELAPLLYRIADALE